MRANPSTAVTSLPLLDAAHCEEVLGRLGAGWSEGLVALPAGAGVSTPVRRCEVAVVDDPWLLDGLDAFLRRLNDDLFGFDLTGFAAADPVCAMRYGVGDHFGWHLDNATLASASRKLGFTLQLSHPADYDGGDLELAAYVDTPGAKDNAARVRARGNITVFPAFHLHRVSPVTRGVRIAVVGWVHGPRFR